MRFLRGLTLLLAFALVSGSTCHSQTNLEAILLLHRWVPPEYRKEISKSMIAEVNTYAAQLALPEHLPITSDSLTELFVSPPLVAHDFGALGNIQTTNFSYGFGKGRHLCYITKVIKGTNPFDYEANKPYAIDPAAVNTNRAYLLATQFLAKAFVDLNRLSTSSVVSIKPWVILHMTTSKYTVQWSRNGEPVVKVVVAEPQKELWTLRVEDPTLILRPPLELPNFDTLLSETNATAMTNGTASP